MLGGIELIEGFAAIVKDDYYLVTGTTAVAAGKGITMGKTWARIGRGQPWSVAIGGRSGRSPDHADYARSTTAPSPVRFVSLARLIELMPTLPSAASRAARRPNRRPAGAGRQRADRRRPGATANTA
jgi:hypothetical protein